MLTRYNFQSFFWSFCAAAYSQSDSGKIDKHYQSLIDTLISHGGEIDKLELYEFKTTGRGMRATEDIEEGDIVLRVPSDILLTSEIAKSSTIGQSIIDLNLELEAKIPLGILVPVVFFMYER